MNHFERPFLLWGLPILLFIAWVYYKWKIYQVKNSLTLSSQTIKFDNNIFGKFIELFPFLKFLTLTLFLLALAGPGQKSELLPEEKNGIDMMIALDVSGSMTDSMDFLPSNRLDVSKDLIQEFIQLRVHDRIGVVIFAGAAYLQAPLTGDAESLKEIISDIGKHSVAEQGTAIGDAIILATYRLKKSKAKSRIILLLTDGVSNTGRLDVQTATETAKEFGIKIYTVGIGKDLGDVSETDFQALKDISNTTGGRFYRALDSGQLEETLKDIDDLEKDKLAAPPKIIIETKYLVFFIPGLLLFLLDLALRTWKWRYYP
jgi:Ca-activated chloride channel homolog